MAASDFDFVQTRTQLIEGALRKVGALGFGESVSGEEAVNAAIALNEMIKEWQAKDVFLWQLVPLTLTVTANSSTVALPTDPPVLGIDDAQYLVTGTTYEDIEVISWREYQAIETKSDAGQIRKITMDNARAGTAYVYPVPTTTTTVRILAIKKLKDWDTATSTGDMPEHWALAIKYGLASLLADDYKLPLNERGALASKAVYYFNRAKGSDRDRSERLVVKGAYE